MKAFRIVFSKIIGLMIFLVLLFLINVISINVYPYRLVVSFINSNAVLIVVMSIIFMIAEVIFSFVFPFNLSGPIFSSLASMFLVKFILEIFSLIDRFIAEDIFTVFSAFDWLIYPVVFIAVLIGGYATIFARLIGGTKEEKKTKKTPKSRKKVKDWDDIGNDFRKVLSDFFRKIADSIEKEK
ncbi:hypothetical protein JXC34_02735 [Candidatus Woesearchaeota archaeon]|nr:hypothetical protein [Candidatus Woesearchaeota archaeon]